MQKASQYYGQYGHSFKDMLANLAISKRKAKHFNNMVKAGKYPHSVKTMKDLEEWKQKQLKESANLL